MSQLSLSFPSSIEGIANARQREYALKDVSFTVNEGERVAIVGPNGAGKSTLLKIIVGTLRPTKGEVNVYGHGPDHHICIAYVPQRNQIDWSFPATVEDVVMMGRVDKIGLFKWPKRQDWQVVEQCLARVHAGELAKKQVGELSGGQQQRVFIARALAQEAELLLLDEPLTGLDMPSQDALFEVLENVRDDGVTVLLATHDLNLAREKFDRVMLLNKWLIAFGQPENVLTSEHLKQAYGGQVHVLGAEDAVLLADGCCGGDV
jgi:manganese/iron transport system ATP-binding protein